MNFLDAQAKNRRKTVGLIALFILLCSVGGVSVDSVLMAGVGSIWFSLFGLILLAFLVPFWIVQFLVKIITLSRKPGEVDDLGYEQESWAVPLYLYLVPFATIIIIDLLWAVTRGASFTLLGIVEAGRGVIATTFPIATVAGFLIGGGEAWWATFHAEQAIISLSKTRTPNPFESPEKQLLNVVEEMSIAAGLPVPRVLILRDRDPNAFSVASAGSKGTIVVTWGLIQMLTREELQAVVGHEMAHMRNRDTHVMTLVSVLFGSMTVIAAWARRGSGLSIGRSPAMLLLPVWIVFGLLSLVLSKWLGLAVSRSREYLADASAVEFCRNPGALISALTKIEADSLPTWNIVRGVAHQCIVDPLGSGLNRSESWWSNLFATHPPMKNRLLMLKAMAYAHD